MADLFASYRCTNCQEDIRELGVRCGECEDLNLCLQCFACGAEIGPHKSDHAYQFMDTGGFPIFGSGDTWTAREEVRLLDAIEQYGFGNWEDISKHIETKTPDQAKEEYVGRYIDGNIGRATWSGVVPTSRPKDHTCPDQGPLSPSLTARLPPLDISQEEASQLGYMPHRDDYEREYDNEAETLVSQLFVNSVEDDDVDVALKLAHVDMYTRSLRERARRKRVVRDFQLVGQFFGSARKEKVFGPPVLANAMSAASQPTQSTMPTLQPPGKRKPTATVVAAAAAASSGSKEDRDLAERLRVFTQFHTAQEHEQFLQNLQKEKDLKFRVRELCRYRRAGLTRNEECIDYEKARYLRERRREKKSGSSGVQPSPQSTAFKIEEKSAVGGIPSPERRYMLPHLTGREDSIGGVKWEVVSGLEVLEQEYASTSALLSSQERKLCAALNLNPSHYVTIKTVLIKDHLQRRKGLCVRSVAPEGLEKSHWQKIVDYCVHSGWISAF